MRLKKSFIFLPLLLLLAFNPYAAKQRAAGPSGKDLYTTHCKSCHGRTGKGLFKLYPPLNDKKFLDNDSLMVAIITQGLKGPIEVSGKTYDKEMPAVEGISNAEIASVVNYIRKEFIDSSKKLSAQKVKLLRKK